MTASYSGGMCCCETPRRPVRMCLAPRSDQRERIEMPAIDLQPSHKIARSSPRDGVVASGGRGGLVGKRAVDVAIGALPHLAPARAPADGCRDTWSAEGIAVSEVCAITWRPHRSDFHRLHARRESSCFTAAGSAAPSSHTPRLLERRAPLALASSRPPAVAMCNLLAASARREGLAVQGMSGPRVRGSRLRPCGKASQSGDCTARSRQDLVSLAGCAWAAMGSGQRAS